MESTSLESYHPIQFGLKQLFIATILCGAYFALVRASDAPLLWTLCGALFLIVRYPCVRFAHCLPMSVPLMSLALILPAIANFDNIAHQWNAPHSRWSSADWIEFPVGYAVFPVSVFIFDAVTSKYWNVRQNWIRLAIEIFLVFPIWMFIILSCVVQICSIP